MRTCYAFITLLLVPPLLTGCSSPAPTTEKAESNAISSAVASAERVVLTARYREDLERAYFDLKALRNPDERNFSVEVTYSKVCFYYGLEIDEGADKDRIWQSGHDAGRIASRLEPGRPDGYFWSAANLNALSKKNPLTVGIKSTQELRDLANRSVEIDPGFENGGALDILGQIELFTGLVGGTPEKAIGYLEQAVRYDTRDGSARLTLAEAYLLSKRDTDARRVLREVIEMTPDPNFRNEHAKTVAKAKRILERRL